MCVCNFCGELKLLSDFYKSNRTKCKECTKRSSRKYREENLEKVKEYDRNRPNHEQRVGECRERSKTKRKSGDLVFIENERLRTRKYRSKNPEKYRANCAVNNAIRDGVLVKPCKCERCESTTNIQGHHWSYLEEHWLDVIWLCTSCHSEEHKLLRANGNNIE
jgi:hypothetical protein